MPIEDHQLFQRPDKDARLWRYTDLPKFLDLLTSGRLWLSNLEILSKEDPYEGLLGSVRFPHRAIRTIREFPPDQHPKLLEDYYFAAFKGVVPPDPQDSLNAAFEHWYKAQEELCITHEAERRNYYINCWHEAECECIAMWKTYGGAGAGVAVVSSYSRLEKALKDNQEKLFLGRVNYVEISDVVAGVSNYFEHLLSKLSHYKYEREVRLAYWDWREPYYPLARANWNNATLRFEGLLADSRPIRPGLYFECKLNELIEMVLLSPFAPDWHLSMVKAVRDRFGFKFPVHRSIILDTPPTPDAGGLLLLER